MYFAILLTEAIESFFRFCIMYIKCLRKKDSFTAFIKKNDELRCYPFLGT